MPGTLSPPMVTRCYFDDAFEPRLPAMCLRWENDQEERVWHLPQGLRLFGPPPGRFGLRIQRTDEEGYDVRLLWDQTSLGWGRLSRHELMSGSLRELLQSMGTDLWYLLEQPVEETQEPNDAA